ncbi:nuclear transport factor 2 family protein [Rhizobium sp. LjRoot254]|uniref:nuclear transport factor 2 family protein n=1 Tax=Rhizobium sp. LjRoot254 TaxID=3342297 RepID=UPI003ED08268
MPDFDPMARLIAYHDAINALDFATIEAMFADNAVYDSGGLGGVVEGCGPIMAGFRSYFDLYPDQVSEDTLIEPVGERAIRSVWKLVATHRLTGEKLIRSGEEIVTFDLAGLIVRVEVTDRAA